MEQNQETLPAVQQPVDTEHKPEDLAATMFSLYYPKFCQKLNKLSNKALRRLAATLVGAPLEDVGFKPKTQEEKDALQIGLSLLDAKMVMLFHTFNEHQDELVSGKVSEQENGTLDSPIEPQSNEQGEIANG